jgi:hypothetical protein
MQKTLFFLLSLCAFSSFAQQNPIVVQHGDSLKYASSLDNALSIAVNDDAIYLPAGSFSTQSGINKKVSIYGVGYRSDSAHISGVTLLQGDVRVLNGANGTLISGVHIMNNVLFGDATSALSPSKLIGLDKPYH